MVVRQLHINENTTFCVVTAPLILSNCVYVSVTIFYFVLITNMYWWSGSDTSQLCATWVRQKCGTQ